MRPQYCVHLGRLGSKYLPKYVRTTKKIRIKVKFFFINLITVIPQLHILNSKYPNIWVGRNKEYIYIPTHRAHIWSESEISFSSSRHRALALPTNIKDGAANGPESFIVLYFCMYGHYVQSHRLHTVHQKIQIA